MAVQKVAIVSGAARGIGAETALALAQAGVATVLLVRDVQAAQAVHERIVALGGASELVACDVADHAAVAHAVQLALARFGRLDIIVNNAGTIDPIGRLADTDPAAWSRSIAVNLGGAYHLAHAALPHLLDGGGGVVLNVSTGAAHQPREGWTAYCSGKAGLWMLTRCIAHEYQVQGISAYGFQPGLVDTGMQGSIRASGLNEISRIPRSDLAPASRPAAVMAWLCTHAPADLRGQDLSINDAALRVRAGLPN